jgi:ABC-2 type transport system permease protein
MLYQIFSITLKDLKVLFADSRGLITLFLMPFMFIVIMTNALGSAFDGPSREPVALLVVNDDTGTLAEKAIAELGTVEGLQVEQTYDGQPVTRALADQLIRDGDRRVAIAFPADFSDRVLARATDPEAPVATVTFVADPAAGDQFIGPIRGGVQGFILREAAYAQVPGQIGGAFDTMAADADPQTAPFITRIGDAFVEQLTSNLEDGGINGTASDPVHFEQVVPEGFEVEKTPTAAEQYVPGYALFGVFFIVQVVATSILREKQDGTFRRLMVAPVSRVAMLLGKVLPYYIVNLLQVVVMFAAGVFMFGMTLGHDPFALALVTLASGAAATGLGLLVAALGKTAEQIGGISSLLVLTLAAIGGAFVPTFLMPEFMQNLSKISPHAWALSGYQDVIVRGLTTPAVLPEVGVLMLFAAVFFSIALWRFKFD